MKYLFDEWERILETLSGRNIFLFLDYDGTLASIADHPDKAVLSGEVKAILNKLTLDPRFNVAVISGRGLSDIKNRVGIKGIIYAGNHGLQIESQQFNFESHITDSYRRVLDILKIELAMVLTGFTGVFIEDKDLSLTIHYRLANKKEVSEITDAYNSVIARYVEEKHIKSRSGKMVFEIMPPVLWNKGYAVTWILSRPEFSGNDFFPIYFGDDITDEDAFLELQGKGLTVLVGFRKQSHAQYFVNDVTEVGKFVDQL